MAYVYRFVDVDEKCSYVGYTGQTLDKRISQHMEKGHLDKSCYNSIHKIEYKKYKTKADAQIFEVYYINKFKPRYNKLNKQNDNLTIELEDDQNWKTYRVIKPLTQSTKQEVGFVWKLISIGFEIYLIYLLIEWLVNIF